VLGGCRALSLAPCEAADGGHGDGEAAPVGPLCTEGCDEGAARTVVYDASGRALYAGQAVLIDGCAGGGGLCHAASAVDRLGAPAGLDYDVFPVQLPSEMGIASEPELVRLGALQRRIVAEREAIWSAVTGGTMPPGAAGRDAVRHSFGWVLDPSVAASDIPVPSITTPEGREILRNWLACRAPLVERWTPVTAPTCADDGACPSAVCAAGICQAVGATVDRLVRPIGANWTSIHAQVVTPSCLGSRCHGGTTASGLDLTDPTLALATLRSGSGTGECGGRPLLVPGDPDASLFFAKLDRAAPCGAAMPPGASLDRAALAAIEAWIEAGAPD
jgi:hypothetical protein